MDRTVAIREAAKLVARSDRQIAEGKFDAGRRTLGQADKLIERIAPDRFSDENRAVCREVLDLAKTS